MATSFQAVPLGTTGQLSPNRAAVPTLLDGTARDGLDRLDNPNRPPEDGAVAGVDFLDSFSTRRGSMSVWARQAGQDFVGGTCVDFCSTLGLVSVSKHCRAAARMGGPTLD